MSRRSLTAGLVQETTLAFTCCQCICNGWRLRGSAGEPDEPVAVPLDEASAAAELCDYLADGIPAGMAREPHPKGVVSAIGDDASCDERSLCGGNDSQLVAVVDVVGDQRDGTDANSVNPLQSTDGETFPNLRSI